MLKIGPEGGYITSVTSDGKPIDSFHLYDIKDENIKKIISFLGETKESDDFLVDGKIHLMMLKHILMISQNLLKLLKK